MTFNSEKFAEYIRSNGGEILPQTNEWELVRYRLPEIGVVVIYQNSKGKITFGGAAREHYKLFKDEKPLKKHKRKGAEFKKIMVEQLAARDGRFCCFCDQVLEDDITLEHFLAIGRAGNNRPENLALAHEQCNRVMADHPIMTKIRLRDAIRAYLAKKPPWEFIDPQTLKSIAVQHLKESEAA